MSLPRKDYIFEPFKVTVVEYRDRDNRCPRPRSGHRIACDDANIYCFGGYNPSLPLPRFERNNATWTPARPLFKELWSFSIARKKWKRHKVIENMPDELASNAMCMYGRYLMIFGGTGAPFGNKCSNDVFLWRAYSGEKKLQIMEVSGTKPPGLYGQSVFCHDGYFYTIGGTNGFAYNCDIFRLDLRSQTWEQVYVGTGQEGEPPGRYRHEVATVDNKFYIIGGGTGEWAFELMEMPMYDLKSKTWKLLFPRPDYRTDFPLAPSPRKCHSAVQFDTPDGVQVIVAGGSDGQLVFDDVWMLDVNKLQWHLMQKTILPRPLYFHGSSVTSYGCMYMFGGIEPNDDIVDRNNTMYKVWVCIPKLSEICWEAMLSLHPNLHELDRPTLLNLGIPLHLVDRLHSDPS
ncbi:kelch domain-containing protein 10 homolog [Ostrinia furnacalis]|uniref:kelch domain-containing protein 10 homolog n=1 Tax=Ostrinia furnacalis TaxID=93504 RepID=UPI00103DA0FE|nr:kelch domain-containing protein 10 homolog [Ostrinia furnacalis]